MVMRILLLIVLELFLSRDPLISVITPTWKRGELLHEMISNLEEQQYNNLEHIIVSEGADDELADSLLQRTLKIPTYYYQAGRNWSSFLPNAFCAAPIVLGQLLAHGDYQIIWADDERAKPEHIQILYNALRTDGTDFAYSWTYVWYIDGSRAPHRIGSDPPREGQITNFLYCTELLKKAFYPIGAGRSGDWYLIEEWICKGAKWSQVPEVTMSHRADR